MKRRGVQGLTSVNPIHVRRSALFAYSPDDLYCRQQQVVWNVTTFAGTRRCVTR